MYSPLARWLVAGPVGSRAAYPVLGRARALGHVL